MMKRISSIRNDLLTAIQFLSRLPLPQGWVNHEKPDFSCSSWSFPLAGLIIALPAILCLALSVLIGIPPLIVAALTICVHIAVCGALHEDGLADCADGFGGGLTRKKKLAIMKDSLLGTYGVTAIGITLLFRFAILSSLLSFSPSVAVIAFLASQCFSRAVQIAFWHSLPAARDAGLSSSFAPPSLKALQWGLGFGVIFTLFLCSLAFSAGSTLIAIALGIGVTIAFRKICLKQIGGQTGDTLGAIQIISEIAFLVGLTTFSF